ncbi:patched domain-containing protein 3-like [Bombina bombina]|uniref:patched domain-containing protein 3-like n=1 Tax=Bombina bombina TaxID=8345 RepID=UPI00235A9B12|nr:patched domain-containing protein 3-like [Bombina bombina]
MNRCHTDCLEKPLSKGFRSLGKLIARYPWLFIAIPIVLSVAFGMGFRYLEQRQSNDLEYQFTPTGGPAKEERDFIRLHFPMNGFGHFSTERLYTDGNFASLIIVNSLQNILTWEALEELQKLDTAVKSLKSESNISFQHVCAQVNVSTCFPANPLLDVLLRNTYHVKLSYPMFQNRTFLGMYLGGVKLGPSDTVTEAKAIKLIYYLREDTAQSKNKSLQWLKHFIKTIPQQIDELQLKCVQVYYSTSISLQNEFEENTRTVIPYFTISFFVTVIFSIVSCMRLDNVRNKVWVALFGVISPGLAIITSFGLLLFCGVPFSVMSVNAPFLILGAGVDDVFIIISCWQQTKVKSPVEERMADTYQEAAVSITITTLTDVLAFYLGIMTHFPSVQSFCTYTGTALVFCYIYCITFFGAVLALNGKHENENRHWLICMKVKDTEEEDNSMVYNKCCVGGSFDTLQGTEKEHPMSVFSYRFYGPFLTNSWTKLLVFVIYIVYLATSIYGCIHIQEGKAFHNLANYNSPLYQFYVIESLYFSKYGPRIMVVVTNEVKYWDWTTHEEIKICMKKLENNYYVEKKYSDSWLTKYGILSKTLNLNITSQDHFLRNLNILYNNYSDYKHDIDRDENKIFSSRFFIQTVNIATVNDEKNMLKQLREIAANCNIPLMVYHPVFIYLDQYEVIIQNTIQNVIVAAAVMLVISLLFIPDPLCSLWVTFAIASIIVGVTGFMAYWKVNLDSISMINLVICIGFSVDFSAHIAYACVSNKKSNGNEMVIDALHSLGYPIVQGALSTILGIVVLYPASSYIFKTFFQIMILVITFGAVHGLVFVPVFLTMFRTWELPCKNKINSPKMKNGKTNTLSETVLAKENPICHKNQRSVRDEIALPGYVDPVLHVINTDITCSICYSRHWQKSTAHQTNDKVKQKDNHKYIDYQRRIVKINFEEVKGSTAELRRDIAALGERTKTLERKHEDLAVDHANLLSYSQILSVQISELVYAVEER